MKINYLYNEVLNNNKLFIIMSYLNLFKKKENEEMISKKEYCNTSKSFRMKNRNVMTFFLSKKSI